MSTRLMATAVALAVTGPACALPVDYVFTGTAGGTVSRTVDGTAEVIDTVSALPFSLIVRADTDAIDATSDAPFTFVQGQLLLSLDNSDFVPDDEAAFVVLDTGNDRIGQFDADYRFGEGFFNDADVPELAGYDLSTSVGPIAGLTSEDFISTEILNEIYGGPVTFDGALDFGFEAQVVPLPAALPLLVTGVGLLMGARAIRRRA